MIVDKVGRRRLVCYVSAPGVILGCVWSIVAFYYLTIDTGFNFVEGTDYPMAKQIALIMGWVFCKFKNWHLLKIYDQSNFFKLLHCMVSG